MRACWNGAPPLFPHSLVATKVTLSQTDRRVAGLGIAVWQLTSRGRIPNSYCLPVLSGDGKLLAITMTDTGGLLLAISTGQLQQMFPKTFGPNTSTAIAPPDFRRAVFKKDVVVRLAGKRLS